MTTTEVQFHSERGRSYAAVNVKIYPSYPRKSESWLPYYERLSISEDAFYVLAQDIQDNITEDWWTYDVQEKAKELGFGEVYSEGRSGGWAVPHPYLYEEDFENNPELLANYKKFAEFCKKSIAGLDDMIYQHLRRDWQDREIAFLMRHSVAVKTISHEHAYATRELVMSHERE